MLNLVARKGTTGLIELTNQKNSFYLLEFSADSNRTDHDFCKMERCTVQKLPF